MPNTKLDEKIYWTLKLMQMPMTHFPYFFYPRVYRVTDIAETVLFNIH